MNPLRFEHVAINVLDVHSTVDWLVKNLGLKVVRAQPTAPFMTFLADASGRTVLEVYTNPISAPPDHKAMHALTLHFGFVVPDSRAERTRLEKAGAKYDSEIVLPDGSILVMMRAPSGLAIQLCQRANPLP